MKKPKIKFVAALFILAVLGIQAGYAQQYTDKVTLQVVLKPVQNISVNTNQLTVALAFEKASDYLNGVASTQKKHLEVSSTGLFQVAVKASTENLEKGDDKIPVKTITITPKFGGSGTDPGAVPSAIKLSNENQIILDSEKGTVQAFYDVEYNSSGGADYINKPEGTYETIVTYTISPT
jgi:hypothetical protein